MVEIQAGSQQVAFQHTKKKNTRYYKNKKFDVNDHICPSGVFPIFYFCR
jgi:hypothetical protein